MVSHARFPARQGKVSHSSTVTITAIRFLITAIRVQIFAIRVLITAIRVLMIAIRVLITVIRVPAWVAEDVDVGRPEGQAL
jgi:hypothetical protein